MSGGGDRQVLVLSSPTGSGKTLMATAFMELIFEGDGGELAGDPNATFLWLSDQPDLNEQTKRKIVATSSIFSARDLITIDNGFDEEVFEPGRVYFLNIQKLGRDRQLVSASDERTFPIWETINKTIGKRPASFLLIIDEAHKGMKQRPADRNAAQTIVQKFIKGSAETAAIPLILGISATPARFTNLLKDVSGVVPRPVTVNISDVRESGLIKDKVLVYYPETGPSADWTLLHQAAESWKRIAEHWHAYAHAEKTPAIRPILVVQVEDSRGRSVTSTDVQRVLQTIERVAGPLGDEEIAHSFQEGDSLSVEGRVIRRIAPPDIQDDMRLSVVLFKLSLNTGWDCPRAEVMMSFRKAVDHTAIAQLVGRMVRTPLARRVERDELLNTVALYLPNYDRHEVKGVVAALTEGDDQTASEIEEGNDFVPQLTRAPDSEQFVSAIEELPSYRVTHGPKLTNVRRLIALARNLDQAELTTGSLRSARMFVIGQLLDARDSKLRMDDRFQRQVAGMAEVTIRGLAFSLGGEAIEENEVRVRLAEANLQDLFVLCEKKLGEGLHVEYVKSRVDEGAQADSAKRELLVLLSDEVLRDHLERLAGQRVEAEFRDRQAAINSLSEEVRAQIIRIIRSARDPQIVPIKLPEQITGTNAPMKWAKHLYQDQDGKYPAAASGWEKPILEWLTSNPTCLVWLRNPPRKDWSFSVTYEDERGDPTNMYPDFLVLRRQGDGFVVDVYEPHRADEGDAARKIKGLGDYADRHGTQLGSIQVITKSDDGVFRTIDLTKDNVRSAAKLAVTTGNVVHLFKEHGVPIS